MFEISTLWPPAGDQPPGKEINGIYQSLLTFDKQLRILIDVGWDPTLSAPLNHLEEIAPTIDLILLTHPTVQHIGAYAVLCHRNNAFRQIPVYATTPVASLGKLAVLDAYRSAGLVGPLPTAELSLQDVESAFTRIATLKYSQPAILSGKLAELTLTAYNAGHSLGGAVWQIQKNQENVVYAVDWNHRADSFLAGSALLGPNGSVPTQLARPSAFVTSAMSRPAPKTREADFLRAVLTGIAGGGSVLLPTSPGARLLELVHVIDRYWRRKRITIPVFVVAHTTRKALSFASAMLEWMAPSVIREWEHKDVAPFELGSYFRLCTSLDDIRTRFASVTGPRVLIASDETLESAFSRSLFAGMCSDERSVVVLTERSPAATLAGQLLKLCDAAGPSGSTKPSMKLHLDLPFEEDLSGPALAAYNRSIQEQKSAVELQKALTLRSETILAQAEDEESSSDEEEAVVLATAPAARGAELGLFLYGGVYDFVVQKSVSNPNGLSDGTAAHVMYPFVLKSRRADDYGEPIRPEEYARKEELEAVHIRTGRPGGRQEFRKRSGSGSESDEGENPALRVGRKQKWADGPDPEQEVDELALLDPLTGSRPRMISRQSIDVTCLCRLQYIDMSGIVDRRSLQMIISQINPRHVVLIDTKSDTVDDTDVLVDGLKSSCPQTEVAVLEPNRVGPVDASANTSSFPIVVDYNLMRTVKWQTISGGASIAHVTGQVALREKPESTTEMILGPVKPSDSFLTAFKSQSLVVGDVRLNEVRARLIALGHKAEYKAEGVLVCDDIVAIRKVNEGSIVVDGGVDDEFYQVRQTVKELLAYL